jgi:hypothetical protein
MRYARISIENGVDLLAQSSSDLWLWFYGLLCPIGDFGD